MTKVSQLHAPGGVKVCAKCCVNPSDSCWDISVKVGWPTDSLANQQYWHPYRATQLECGSGKKKRSFIAIIWSLFTSKCHFLLFSTQPLVLNTIILCSALSEFQEHKNEEKMNCEGCILNITGCTGPSKHQNCDICSTLVFHISLRADSLIQVLSLPFHLFLWHLLYRPVK